MDFLNGFGKKLTKAARTVQELTRDGNRPGSGLRSARETLAQSCEALGYACLECADCGMNEIPAEPLRRALEARAAFEAISENRLPVRTPVHCSACGAAAPDDARFCPRCGKRLPETLPAVPPADDAEYCPVCGAMRRGDSDYCAVCGRDFRAPDPASLPVPAAALPGEPPEEPEIPADYGE